MLNKQELHDDLKEMFMLYQHQPEIPLRSVDETKATVMAKYDSDKMFRWKVDSLTNNVMLLILQNEK